MAVFGYARASTLYQSTEIQIEQLKAAGCELVRTEKKSGTSRDNRTELQTLLDFVRAGDVLMVTRVDRLARSIGDLQDIVRLLKAKGVALRATEQPIDTGTAAGKAFLDMLGVLPNLKPISARNVSLRALPRPRRRAFTKVDLPRSSPPKLPNSRTKA